MGKYSNVNASGILSACSSALSEIGSYNFQSLHSGLSSLQTKAKAQLSSAYGRITGGGGTGSIGNLKNKISKLQAAAQKIVQYQQAEQERDSLLPDLYYWHDDGGYVYNPNTQKQEWRSNWQRHINYAVQARIEALEQQMQQLESAIDGML